MGWKHLAEVVVMTLCLSGAALVAQAQPADSYRALERVEIQELFSRYAWAMDYGDCDDAFVKLFADDGVVGAGNQDVKGPTALRNWCAGLWKLTLALDPPNRIFHIISNVKIDFKGPDAAHADVMWTEIWRPDPYKGSRGTWAVRQSGAYHDELVKRNGRWLFGRHVLAQTMPAVGCVDGPPGTVPPPPFCDPSLPRHKN